MTLSLIEAQHIAFEMLNEYLDDTWSFSFDRAKRRAGACHYSKTRISVSQFFVMKANEAEFRQVMLHEISHALAGPLANHGPEWKRIARTIGYTGNRTLEKQFGAEYAPWVGTCPGLHEHLRFRKPARVTSCSVCHPRFNRRYIIEWSHIPAHTRI